MELDQILTGWQLNSPVTEESVIEADRSLGSSLPDDYIRFLRDHNGGEGFVGENYLILWKAEELALFNQDYEVNKYAPGLILFGSSGGGEAYAFDARDDSMPVVRVPFIGMELRYATLIARSFTDLFPQLTYE